MAKASGVHTSLIAAFIKAGKRDITQGTSSETRKTGRPKVTRLNNITEFTEINLKRILRATDKTVVSQPSEQSRQVEERQHNVTQR